MGILGGIPLKSWDSFPKLIPARNRLSLNSRNRNSCRNSLRNVFDVFDASSKCLFSQVSGALKSLWRLKSTWQHPEGHTRPHKESKPGLWQRIKTWLVTVCSNVDMPIQRPKVRSFHVSSGTHGITKWFVLGWSFILCKGWSHQWEVMNPVRCMQHKPHCWSVLHSWTCNGQD